MTTLRTEISCATFSDKCSKLVKDQSEWSQETFGSDHERGPLGALRHLEMEAVEAQKAFEEGGNLIEELADCFLLIVDASRRSGLELQELVDASQEKLEINKQRNWPKPTDDSTPVEHIPNESEHLSMLLEANELSQLLAKEDEYIEMLKKRWGRAMEISAKAEHDLRMGKRTELLGDLQWEKQRPKDIAATS